MPAYWRPRRQQLAIQLEDLGCKPVDGDLYSDWLWHCRWCGYDEYIEIPREWPIPKGAE